MTKGKVEMSKFRTGRKGGMAKCESGRSEDVVPVARDQTSSRAYDLASRTQCFGSAIVAYARGVPLTPVTRSLISQLVRAGTSVGANYCEADGAESRKDFRHRIAIAGERPGRPATGWRCWPQHCPGRGAVRLNSNRRQRNSLSSSVQACAH